MSNANHSYIELHKRKGSSVGVGRLVIRGGEAGYTILCFGTGAGTENFGRCLNRNESNMSSVIMGKEVHQTFCLKRCCAVSANMCQRRQRHCEGLLH